MSLGTVSVIDAVRRHAGLSLSEAKRLIDRAVFDGETVEVTLPTVGAARTLAAALVALESAPPVVLSLDPDVNDFPTALASTCRLVLGAYPAGLSPDDPDYGPVVATIASKCSRHNAASVLEVAFGRERGFSYDDVLRYTETPPTQAQIERVTARLAPHGLEEWLRETD
jgi:hypothetical protein